MEQRDSESILLTSIGLSAKPAYEFIKNVCASMSQVVSIVVTASEGKKENKYVKLAIGQFTELGVKKINLVDLELGEVVPNDTTIVYVSGGNTFELMHFVRETNFNKTIENILNKNGIYIGVSAGAIILGNSIEGALMVGDVDTRKTKNFNGLGFIDYTIFPHSNESTHIEVMELKKFKNPLFIENNEAFLVEFKDKKYLTPHLLLKNNGID